MKRFAILCAVALCAALATAAATPLKGFSRNTNADLFGYFLPAHDVRIGKFKLSALSLGGRDEFKKFESGKREIRNYAPFMFEFDDVTSKQKTNEMGGQYYEHSVRVLPSAYRIAGNILSFAGNDKELGSVTFDGAIDLAALKASHAAGPNGSDKIIVTGTLSVGGKVFKNLKFTWFGGD